MVDLSDLSNQIVRFVAELCTAAQKMLILSRESVLHQGQPDTFLDLKSSAKVRAGGKGSTHEKSEESAHRQERDAASY